MLVLRPVDIAEFSVAMVFRSKTQCAGNGCSLPKCCNAVAGYHSDALWVSLSMPTWTALYILTRAHHCRRGTPCHEH